MEKEAEKRGSSPETNVEALLSDPSQDLSPQIEAAIKSKWQKIVGPDVEIVVSVYLLFFNFLCTIFNNHHFEFQFFFKILCFVSLGGAIKKICRRKRFRNKLRGNSRC